MRMRFLYGIRSGDFIKVGVADDIGMPGRRALLRRGKNGKNVDLSWTRKNEPNAQGCYN